jgi:hypothetical protein
MNSPSHVGMNAPKLAGHYVEGVELVDARPGGEGLSRGRLSASTSMSAALLALVGAT